MDESRRSLLRRGALVAGAGLTGCLSGDSNVRYPETDTAAPRTRAAARDDGTETPQDDGGTAGPSEEVPVPHSELGAETDRIAREVEWFATTYPEAIETYRAAMRTAANRVAGFRRAEAFTAADYDALTDELNVQFSLAATAVGGHFDTMSFVEREVFTRTNAYMKVVERFTERGDLDRIDEELVRLEKFLRGSASDPFVREAMPRNPIRNRLFGWLRRDWRLPVAFVVAFGTGFRAYSFGNPEVSVVDRPGKSVVKNLYDGVLGPTLYDEGRQSRVLIQPVSLPLPPEDVREETVPPVGYVPPNPRPFLSEFGALDARRAADDETQRAVLLQRYGSVAGATAARRALVEEGPLAEELSYRFGTDGEKWRRIRYRYADDVWYAYLIQAGPYLLTTGASQTAWEERVDWSEPLERTWLWSGEVEVEGSTAGDDE